MWPASRAALLVLALAPPSVAAASVTAPGQCPVEKCQAGGASLLQVGRGTGGGERPEGKIPCKEVSSYNVDFLPGHFMCMSCDARACDGCSVLCDISSCVGEFYTEECWCEAAGGSSKPSVNFCDETCGGGLCDGGGQACRPKESGCKPWWWCGSSPPTSLVQTRAGSRLRLSAGAAQQQQEQFQQLQGQRRSVASAAARLRSFRELRRRATSSAAEAALKGQAGLGLRQRSNASLALPPEVKHLHFQDARFDCHSGALPPKTRDPASLLWVERGYIVLDARSCEGSLFDHKCYCWDNFLHLQGKDPLTSELKCDSDCKWGPCAGKTCSSKPPPPLSRLKQKRVLPGFTRIDSGMDVTMEAYD